MWGVMVRPESYMLGALLPVSAVHPHYITGFPLGEVHEATVDEDGDYNQHQEQAKLFVRLTTI